MLEDHDVETLTIKYQDGLTKGMARIEKWANAGHDALQKRLEEMGLYQASSGAETPPKGRKKKSTKKRG